MTLATLTPGELLSVRIYKTLDSRPDTVWTNSYELRVRSGESTLPGSSTARAAVDVLKDFEKGFHLTDVLFNRAVVSSFVEDGQPYNPETFVSVPFSGERGTKPSGDEPQALAICLMLRRAVLFGRTGRALYRRCLLESEVRAPSGTASLSVLAQTALASQVGEAFTQMRQSLLDEGLELVLAKGAAFGPGVQVREVIDMEVGGVVNKKLNNRYFDRA